MKMKVQEKKKVMMVCAHNSNAALTVGRSYEILDEDENKVYVIDDNGKRNSYYKSRFEDEKLVTNSN